MASGINIKDRAPVSVVIPCFNCADTIERAVQSVANQTLLPSEVWIIDDGSNDRSRLVIETLQKKYEELSIKTIFFSSNSGPSSARNAGWDAASQPYIAFLDADDSWHPQKIEIQYKWMKEHQDAVLTGHEIRWLRREMVEKDVLNESIEFKKIKLFDLLIKHYFPPPSVMIKKDIPFRFDDTLRYAEDYGLWLKIAGTGLSLYYLKFPLAFIYKAPYGEGGLSKDLWAFEKSELKVFKKLNREGIISIPLWTAVSLFSILKFIRRLIIVNTRKVLKAFSEFLI